MRADGGKHRDTPPDAGEVPLTTLPPCSPFPGWRRRTSLVRRGRPLPDAIVTASRRDGRRNAALQAAVAVAMEEDVPMVEQRPIGSPGEEPRSSGGAVRGGAPPPDREKPGATDGPGDGEEGKTDSSCRDAGPATAAMGADECPRRSSRGKRSRAARAQDSLKLKANADDVQGPGSESVLDEVHEELRLADASFVSRLLTALLSPQSRRLGSSEADFWRTCDALASADMAARADAWLPSPPRFFAQVLDDPDDELACGRRRTSAADLLLQEAVRGGDASTWSKEAGSLRHLMYVTCYDAVASTYARTFSGYGSLDTNGSYMPHALALQALMARVQCGVKIARNKYRAGLFDHLKQSFEVNLDGNRDAGVPRAEAEAEDDDDTRALTAVLKRLITDEGVEARVLRNVEACVRRSFRLMGWGRTNDIDETTKRVRRFYVERVIPLTKVCQMRTVMDLMYRFVLDKLTGPALDDIRARIATALPGLRREWLQGERDCCVAAQGACEACCSKGAGTTAPG